MARTLAPARAAVAGRALVAGRGTVPTSAAPAPPVISGVVVSEVTPSGAQVAWDLDRPCQGWVEYGTTDGGPYPGETAHEASFLYAHHAQVITGLAASTTHYLRVVAVSPTGQVVRSAQASFATASGAPEDPPPPDPGPGAPVFTVGPAAGVPTQTSVSVSWTCDQYVQGWVEYGTTTSYGSETTHETSFRYAAHSQVLSALAPGTTYHYRVHVANAAAQAVVSGDLTFATQSDPTPPPPDPDPPPPPPDPPPSTPFDVGYTYVTTNVPIDGWTGGNDVRSQLQSLINGAADGSGSATHRRIVFPAGYTYVLSGYVQLNNRAHVTIEGSGSESTYGNVGGAWLVRVGGPPHTSNDSSILAISHYNSTTGYRDADVRIHALNFRGTSVRYKTAVTDQPTYQHGVNLRSVDGARVSHCVFERLGGDCVYVAAAQSSPGTASRNVLLDGNLFKDNERMGVAIVEGQQVTIRANEFRDIFYACIDFEPNATNAVIRDFLIEDNLFSGYWSYGTSYSDGCIKIDAQNTVDPLTNGYYTIRDNTVTGRPYSNAGQGWFAGYYGNSLVKDGHLTITGNTCTQPQAGPFARLRNWAGGATITSNTGFLSSGSVVQSDGGNGTITQSGNS